jgi:hypothetical protein
MSWEFSVVIREGENLGNVSATWTDPSLGVFTHSRCSRINVASADAFIAEAIAGRDSWRINQQDNITKSAWALDRLNAADPEVT